jgi:hypothetical protein
MHGTSCPSSPAALPPSNSVPSKDRLDWAALQVRFFGVDVLQYSRCEATMRLIACIDEPDMHPCSFYLTGQAKSNAG